MNPLRRSTDSTQEPEDDYFEDPDDDCWNCGGDGMDPLSDYALPCPFCWEGP